VLLLLLLLMLCCSGDLLAAVRRKSHQWLSVLGNVSTREILQQCPWIQLPSAPSSVALSPNNLLTTDFYALAVGASRKSICALKAEVKQTHQMY
jgi:hypothetical protein